MKTTIQNIEVSLDYIKQYAKDHFTWRGDFVVDSEYDINKKNYFIVIHHISIAEEDHYVVSFSTDIHRIEDLHDEDKDVNSDFPVIQSLEDVIYMFTNERYTGFKFIERRVIQDTDLGF